MPSRLHILVCVDCSHTFVPTNQRGPTSDRCSACRATRARDKARERSRRARRDRRLASKREYDHSTRAVVLALNWARQHHLLAGSIPSGVYMWTLRSSMTPGRWARLVNDAAEVRARAPHGDKCAAVWSFLEERGLSGCLVVQTPRAVGL